MGQPVVIVGAGLAGSCLALELEANGWEVWLVDGRTFGASSRFATGLMHPYAPRQARINLEVLTSVKTALDWYAAMGRSFNLPLHSLPHQVPARRIFRNPDEAEAWAAAGFVVESNGSVREWEGAWGSAALEEVHRLDCEAFLAAVEDWFAARGRFRTGVLGQWSVGNSPRQALADLGLPEQTLKAPLVLCLGWNLSKWSTLIDSNEKPPLKPAAGLSLVVELPWTGAEALWAGPWLVPLSNGRWLLSASNSWDLPAGEAWDSQWIRDQTAWLLARLRILWTGAVNVIDYLPGIRPASRDRQTIMQPLAIDPSIWLVNGLGSHGCVLGPRVAVSLRLQLGAGQKPFINFS